MGDFYMFSKRNKDNRNYRAETEIEVGHVGKHVTDPDRLH